MANWTEDEIQKVWEKAMVVDGYDKDVYRQDVCGAWIQRNQYGTAKTNESHTSFTWQIDHVKPESKGGKDVLSNVRPLQWYNNDVRQNGRLKPTVTAEGDHNVEKD